MTPLEYWRSKPMDWSRIPGHCVGQLKSYVEFGRPTGGFLRAVLENDLRGAVRSADNVNRTCLADIVDFLYNNFPEKCWGSAQKYEEWIRAEGLSGMEGSDEGDRDSS